MPAYGYGAGYGQRRTRGSARTTYDPAAAALFAAMTEPPSQARKALISAKIGAMKTAGLWSKYDVYYEFRAHDAQAARLNWKDPAAFALALADAPTFTVDRGYKGDAVNDGLGSTYNPSTFGGQFTQNAASIGVWVRQAASYDGASLRADIYVGLARISRRNTTSAADVSYRVNDATGTFVTPAALTGLFVANRPDSANKELYRNGGVIGTAAVASTGVSTVFELLKANSLNFSDAELSLAFAGGALSAQNIADQYALEEAWRVAVGA